MSISLANTHLNFGFKPRAIVCSMFALVYARISSFDLQPLMNYKGYLVGDVRGHNLNLDLKFRNPK